MDFNLINKTHPSSKLKILPLMHKILINISQKWTKIMINIISNTFLLKRSKNLNALVKNRNVKKNIVNALLIKKLVEVIAFVATV